MMTATTIPTFEEVWDSHKNLIYKLALSFNAGNEHRSDLVQCGRIGIHRAIQTYQPEKGGKFISWVITHVKKEMINYLNDNLRTIRIPVSQLRQQDRETFPTENMHSLDDSIYDDGEPLYSTIAYEEETHEINLFILYLRHFLPKLKESYQNILKLRYFEEKTYEEIADELNMTRENVRQLHDKAINTLQEFFGVEKSITKYQRIKTQKR